MKPSLKASIRQNLSGNESRIKITSNERLITKSDVFHIKEIEIKTIKLKEILSVVESETPTHEVVSDMVDVPDEFSPVQITDKDDVVSIFIDYILKSLFEWLMVSKEEDSDIEIWMNESSDGYDLIVMITGDIPIVALGLRELQK
ncbi:hypothetical protein RJG79_10655 [Mycoplasmatota bacterium WC44]